MHDDPCLRQEFVHLAVDRPRGRIDVRPLFRVVRGVGIEQDEVARLDAREVAPFGIHQEFAPVRRHRGAEMVGDGFVHSQLGDDAEGGGEVDAKLVLIRHGSHLIHLPSGKPSESG